MENNTQVRGFAAMDPEKRREIASKGGKAAHSQGKAHQFDSSEARLAGQKGGLSVSRNVEHMRTIGRKGGATVSANTAHMRLIGQKGGRAVSADRQHMAEIGRKGGTTKATNAEKMTNE